MVDRDSEALHRAAEGAGVFPVECDVSDPAQVSQHLAVHSPEIISAYRDAISSNRYGSEQEVAQLMAFLCSDTASYISGQVIAADR